MSRSLQRRLERLEAAVPLAEAVIIVAYDRADAERQMAQLADRGDPGEPTIILTGVPRPFQRVPRSWPGSARLCAAR